MNKYHCPLCGHKNAIAIYETSTVPLIQNKIYKEQGKAIECPKGHISLCQCSCGFVFNNAFDASQVEYDASYLNDQANSSFFVTHVDSVCNFLSHRIASTDNITEIGCGQQAFFLERLKSKGFTVTGYDPSYGGTAPYIHKEYFSKQTVLNVSNVIILRHVFEHIENPFDFLHSIAEANQYHGKIYIEVPCFDWIHQQNAFWDICYEHVNYFSRHVFNSIFSEAEIGHCFGGQYLYVFAELKNLLPKVAPRHTDTQYSLSLPNTDAFFSKNTSLYVWDAGAKGNIFCNIVDPQQKHVTAVIDIHPKKQNTFLGGSGHPVISPDMFLQNYKNENALILIMNQNYYPEIKSFVEGTNIQLACIEQLSNFSL